MLMIYMVVIVVATVLIIAAEMLDKRRVSLAIKREGFKVIE